MLAEQAGDMLSGRGQRIVEVEGISISITGRFDQPWRRAST